MSDLSAALVAIVAAPHTSAAPMVAVPGHLLRLPTEDLRCKAEQGNEQAIQALHSLARDAKGHHDALQALRSLGQHGSCSATEALHSMAEEGIEKATWALQSLAFLDNKQAMGALHSMADQGNKQAMQALCFLAEKGKEQRLPAMQLLHRMAEQGNKQAIQALQLLASHLFGNRQAVQALHSVAKQGLRSLSSERAWLQLDDGSSPIDGRTGQRTGDASSLFYCRAEQQADARRSLF